MRVYYKNISIREFILVQIDDSLLSQSLTFTSEALAMEKGRVELKGFNHTAIHQYSLTGNVSISCRT
jgi:hypothetical protein